MSDVRVFFPEKLTSLLIIVSDLLGIKSIKHDLQKPKCLLFESGTSLVEQVNKTGGNGKIHKG